MAETLTIEQRQAVENRGGKLLVSAAAGSGKTKVLVDRLMSYILDTNDPANIDDFLIITYTKAAAAELRGKIASKLSELIALDTTNRHLKHQMQRLYLAKISTVHGFCTEILRQYPYMLDIAADFRVADESECLELQLKALDQVLNDAYNTEKANADFFAFVDSQGIGRDDRLIPEIILKVYNSARCHLNPDQWLNWCVAEDFTDVTDAADTTWGRFLISDLKQYLSMQIEAMSRCASAAELVEGMEKPVSLFQNTVHSLEELYSCTTWDGIVEKKEIDFGRLIFPKNCKDLLLADRMKAVRNACRDGLAKRLRNFSETSEQVLTDLSNTASAGRGLVQLVRSFDDTYIRLKRSRGILDFGDLEHLTLDLLIGKKRSAATSIAHEIGARFREIMVDEYQDSNRIQDEIFASLTQKRNNCFMVGDVKQSIYQFRLAEPGIFIEKYNTYTDVSMAKAGEGRKVLLSNNFRSSGGVICAVNDVFSRSMSPEVGGLFYGHDEMLHEGIPHTSLNEPEVSLYCVDVNKDTYAEEAAFVADKIVDLLNGKHMVRDGADLRPIAPEDIVILLRSPGSVGAEYQYALHAKGIRCLSGDAGDLLQTEEIAAVRSILQIIDNPLQDIPLVAAMTSRVFGFTADDLAVLRSDHRYSDVYTALKASDTPKCKKLLEVLHELRNEARQKNVTQLLASIYSKTNLLSSYSAMHDGEARLDNLQTFFQLVSDYESAGPKELSKLLEYLNAAETHGLTAPGKSQDKGAVTIMSIHKSKGLEFPVVFLCGLSRTFNMESARGQVLCDRDLGLGLSCMDLKHRVRYPNIAKRAISRKVVIEGISEELRVLYVAMTRARDRLIMTYAVKNLPDELQSIASRLDMSSPQLLVADVTCPGDWVLQTALTRTEAGELFAISSHPDCANVTIDPWDIHIGYSNPANLVACTTSNATQSVSKEQLCKLSNSLKFAYGYCSATQTPSKLTATQLKGRALDAEIAEGTTETKVTVFRKPGRETSIAATAYGTAVHAVLQYIRFDKCLSVSNVRQELERIANERLITHEQKECIDCNKIVAFFETQLGQKLISCENVVREFKFSILDDASKYYHSVSGEHVLLQGVVDCAMIENDGITVIDFKTDRVTEDSLHLASEKYRTQVEAYASALERIYRLPVKSAVLYFFEVNKFIGII